MILRINCHLILSIQQLIITYLTPRKHSSTSSIRHVIRIKIALKALAAPVCFISRLTTFYNEDRHDRTSTSSYFCFLVKNLKIRISYSTFFQEKNFCFTHFFFCLLTLKLYFHIFCNCNTKNLVFFLIKYV